MGKLWTESINKHIDWGGDPNTTNLPVSGKKVQEFIKDSLNKKSGVFYKDYESSKYLIFSDEEDKNTYLDDKSKTNLIIGEIVIPSSLSELKDDVVKDKYLSLSGGILKGISPYNQYVLTLNTDNEFLVGLRLQSKDGDKGSFEWSSEANEGISGIRIRNIITGDCLGLSDSGVPMYNTHTLLHSDNCSKYALSLDGGTLSNASSDILTINRINSTSPTTIMFQSSGTLLGRLGFSPTLKQPVVQITGSYNGVYQTILHSGNYSDYALPLSGGEMMGKLVMYNRISMGNQVIEMGKGLFGAYNDGEKLYWLTPSNETWNEILTSAGGTIDSGSNDVPLVLKSSGTTTWLKFTTNDGKNRYIGVGEDNTLKFQYGGASYSILHSGNYWEYALKNAGYIQDVPNTDTRLTQGDAVIIPYFQTWGGQKIGSYRLGAIRMSSGTSESQLVLDHYNGNIKYRHYGESTWSDWKTIAFTDSNVASAYSLRTKDDKYMVYLSNLGNLMVGDNIATGATHIIGNNVILRYGTSATNGLILNSSGNVTIGAEDLAGSDYKLYANKVGAEIYHFVRNKANYGYIGLASSSNNDITISTDSTGKLWLNGNGNTIMNYYGGNVLIGNTQDDGSGAKLQVTGDLRVTGNIIADGKNLNALIGDINSVLENIING